ncbi:hypothetical protein CLUG_00915 [Clavispora lusitaniae ATCC 42720]|uniref:Calponin-homology (CH) domain-containing protein n=1 Tax=Clavispora lusitaniae (strain ATCC 42720) TaxID=306902 RepID=C4XY92_CLAL4|nr:uncharacterized protein CLUG_00915 [Clavispora lusitaniae ATCC 42720]EEQ36792.1 hypothetical protein CLUG_00915 [Clavispora lusitaniae ATCC 42720]
MSSWASAQERTMARWLSSKINTPIVDLVSAVGDGLVLVQLINCISAETGASSYILSPVHPRPTFRIHKLENVADVLQFCRLELKINTCNISAENIVDGDVKLILGMIWTLFVFATSQSMSMKNETSSVAEIKAILLKWLNNVCRRRALPVLSNFNSDWSFQRMRRPDLVFACILDTFLPGLVTYDDFPNGKMLANMELLCNVAETKLGIAPLAVPEDFNMLVPDEKCIIFYVLQWYLFFESADDATVVQDSDNDAVPASPKDSILSFLSSLISAVKLRNRYETMSLRLVNHINNARSSLSRTEESLERCIASYNMSCELNQYCAELSTSDWENELAGRGNSVHITNAISSIRNIMSQYEQFRLQVKPVLFHQDLPELKALFKSVQAELKKCGISSGYLPSKQLSLFSICDRLALLDQLDRQVGEKLQAYVEELRWTKLQKLGSLVSMLHSTLHQQKSISEPLKAFVDSIDMLSSFKCELDVFGERIRQKHTTAELRAIIGSAESLDVPDTPVTPEQSAFEMFKALVAAEQNQRNLSGSDIRDFLKRIVPVGKFSSLDVSSLLQAIPTRRLLVRSESDNLMSYASDDSEDSGSVFEEAQRQLEHKLLGNYNILYDLDAFVTRMENGFKL